ncbi:hypothetical protein B9G69_015415 [Bdellovibrio sp. SKB1291214]|uniref:hypothetical protein n=1 Tax=Bdellovibrio sp. SKB1291214 TaxID=1732569 RepID=UPI000B518319|nr:hypothetical protein [Bdellovibrio sp. SKB1291214]UYL08431.1 hypothetical protein B9G69_015415 [Bdellovibrio sp. SKB1291214]
MEQGFKFRIFPSYTHHVYEESADKARSFARLKQHLVLTGGKLVSSSEQEFRINMYESDIHPGLYLIPMLWKITVKNRNDSDFIAVEIVRASERRFATGFFCVAIVTVVLGVYMNGSIPNLIFILVFVYAMAWLQSKMYISPAYSKLRKMIENCVGEEHAPSLTKLRVTNTHLDPYNSP